MKQASWNSRCTVVATDSHVRRTDTRDKRWLNKYRSTLSSGALGISTLLGNSNPLHIRGTNLCFVIVGWILDKMFSKMSSQLPKKERQSALAVPIMSGKLVNCSSTWCPKLQTGCGEEERSQGGIHEGLESATRLYILIFVIICNIRMYYPQSAWGYCGDRTGRRYLTSSPNSKDI